ncbi:hypothetical protein DVH24_018370 [Malus domestica]|uniref:GHMP kinase N-terminal domain-containing protein n=1 Tax=Malus domestica TaxID=3750 RepID=A0A498KFC4_MALDO|nr:hypothetical protein DVH24_018370 [Malus domestica]
MAICHQSPFKPFTLVPLQSSKHNPIHLRCNFSLPSRPILTISEPEPVFTSVKAFAPATVTNLGLGFDFLGYTVDGLGDFTSLTIDPQVLPGEISISEICGDHNSKKLSKNPSMSFLAFWMSLLAASYGRSTPIQLNIRVRNKQDYKIIGILLN